MAKSDFDRQLDLIRGGGSPLSGGASDFDNQLSLIRGGVSAPLARRSESQDTGFFEGALDTSLGALGYIGDAIDRPGNALRGALSGNFGGLKGLIPFSETLGIFGNEDRTSGQDLLESFGLFDEGEDEGLFSLKGAAGLGVELLADPLNLLPGYFGLKATTRLGKGAKTVGSQIARADKLSDMIRGGAKYSDALNPSKLTGGLKTVGQEADELAKMFGREVFEVGSDGISRVADTDLLKSLQGGTTDLAETARLLPEGSTGRYLDDAGERVAAGQENLLSFGGEVNPIPFGPTFNLPEFNLAGRGKFAQSAARGIQKFGQAIPNNRFVAPFAKLFNQDPLDSLKTGTQAAEQAAAGQLGARMGMADKAIRFNNPDLASDIIQGLKGEKELTEFLKTPVSKGVAKVTPEDLFARGEAQGLKESLDGAIKEQADLSRAGAPPEQIAAAQGKVEQLQAEAEELVAPINLEAASATADEALDAMPATVPQELSEESVAALKRTLSDAIEGGETPEGFEKLVGTIQSRYGTIAKVESDWTGLVPLKGSYAPHVLTGGGREFFGTLNKEPGMKEEFVGLLNEKLAAKGRPPLKTHAKPSLAVDPSRRTNEANKLLEGTGLGDETLENMVHGSTYQREYRGLTLNEINDTARQLGAEADVFNSSPLDQLYVRELRHIRVNGGIDMIKGVEGLGIGTKIPAGLKTTSTAVPGAPGVSHVVDEAGNSVGFRAEGLKGAEGTLFADAETAAQMGKVMSTIGSSHGASQLLDLYDKFTRVFKSEVTRGFPAFHVRNMLSNRIQSWFEGVNPWGAHRTISDKFISGKDLQVKFADGTTLGRKELEEEMKSNGVLTGGFFDDMAKNAVDANKKDQTVSGRLTDVLSDNPLIRAGEKVGAGIAGAPGQIFGGGSPSMITKLDGTIIENRDRVAHYVFKRQEGLSPEAAAESVNKALFDYTGKNQSKFEKKYLNRAFLFYSYTRNVVPFMIEKAMTNSNKTIPWLKLANQRDEDSHLPPWIAEGLAIPLGKDAAGQSTFLSGLDTPVEAALEPFSGFGGGVGRGIAKIASSFNPLIKAPIEAATGQDLFLGRPIKDLNKAPNFTKFLPDSVKEALGINSIFNKDGIKLRDTADPYALWLLRQTPISRLSNTLSKASDEKKLTGDVLANILTGGSIVSIDEDRQRKFAERDAITERLQELTRTGRAREVPGIFAAGRGEGGVQDEEAKRLIKILRGGF